MCVFFHIAIVQKLTLLDPTTCTLALNIHNT